MNSVATLQRAAPRARAPTLVLAAGAGLTAVVAGAIWIALGAAGNDSIVDTASAPEPGWLAGPLHGLAPGLSDAGFSVALLAMLGGYFTLVALADLIETRLLIAAIALAVVALTLAPPILSSDIFGYVAYARLGTLYHLNPYTHAPIAAPGDPNTALVYWQHQSSPYGGLFTLASYALGRASAHFAVWALKAAAALGVLTALAFTVRAAANLGVSRARAVAVVGANPLLLVYGVGGGHNDLLVLASVTGAVALLAARRPAASGAAFVVGVALKITAALALPFALLGARERSRLALGSVGAGAIALATTLVLFGPHVVDTPLRIATSDSFDIAYSGPDLLGRLLGTGIDAGVRALGASLAAAAVVFGLWRVHRGGDWLDAAGWATLVVLVAIPSFVPWYIAWLVPFAALGTGRRLLPATLALTAVVVVTHLPSIGFGAYQ